MSDGKNVDARHFERIRQPESAGALVSKVLEKCQSEINSTGDRQATIESIAKTNVRGYVLIIRRKVPMTAGLPSSIWFFPDKDSIAIESCYPNRAQTLKQFDASELSEQFIWEQVSRFIGES
ncbi:hypothetical protein [Rhodopirellula baltica]